MMPAVLLDGGFPDASETFGIPNDHENMFGLGKLYFGTELIERFRNALGREPTDWEFACDWYERDFRVIEWRRDHKVNS